MHAYISGHKKMNGKVRLINSTDIPFVLLISGVYAWVANYFAAE
jgi:hypothetical protein